MEEVFMLIIGNTLMLYKSHKLDRFVSYEDRDLIYLYGDTEVCSLNTTYLSQFSFNIPIPCLRLR